MKRVIIFDLKEKKPYCVLTDREWAESCEENECAQLLSSELSLESSVEKWNSLWKRLGFKTKAVILED